jgi:hypothetical protein
MVTLSKSSSRQSDQRLQNVHGRGGGRARAERRHVPALGADRFRQYGSVRWIKPGATRRRLLCVEQMDRRRSGQRERRRSQVRLREPVSARQQALQAGPLLLTAWSGSRTRECVMPCPDVGDRLRCDWLCCSTCDVSYCAQPHTFHASTHVTLFPVGSYHPNS